MKSVNSESGGQKRKRKTKKGKRGSFEEQEMMELLKIVQLLPKDVQKALQTHPNLEDLIEVVMDLGRLPFARFPDGDLDLSQDEVTSEDLESAIAQLGEFGGDNRAGISGTLHRISCIRNRKGGIIGLTARVGRHVSGSAEIVADIIKEGRSILVLGFPGRGKTTAIRSMCKLLADAEKKRVVVVDTSNEIAGDGDIPHAGIGRSRRMQVSHPSIQHEVMIEAVENHMPQVIVIDEIGTELECSAARTISQRGVQLIATAHGTELENVIKNPQLQDLIGGIECVTLGDDEARKRGVQKSVLERAAPPAFDVAIEMVERNVWRVHHDLAEAVDLILSGGTAYGEIRTRSEDGEITIKEGRRPAPAKLPLVQSRPLTPVPFGDVSSSDDTDDLVPSTKRGSRPMPREDKRLSEQDIRGYQQDGWNGEWSGDSDWDFHEAPPPASKVKTAASTVALRLFLIGVEPHHLQEILEVLGLRGQVAVTPYLKKAHAVLGMQTDIRRGTWVEKAARVAGIPLFSLNSKSNMALAKAIQSLLGLSSSTQSISKPETIKAAETTQTKDARKEQTELTMAESNALDEVRFAIEDIILARNQPVELMPQIPRIIDMQMEIIKDYGLPCQMVGEGKHTRLRIYPSSDENEDPEN